MLMAKRVRCGASECLAPLGSRIQETCRVNFFYLEPVAVAVWAAVITISFVLVLMLIRVSGSLRHVRAYRRELVVKAQGLRMHKMLSRAGTTLSRYLRRAGPIDVELQLLTCEHCETTDLCDKYLDQGEDIDPRTFCPNFARLTTHKRKCGRHCVPGELVVKRPLAAGIASGGESASGSWPVQPAK